MATKNDWDSRVAASLARRFPGSPRLTTFYEKIWRVFSRAGLADAQFVTQFARPENTYFSARVWEMRLAHHLLSCGYRLERCPDGEPDFRFAFQGRTVWVEATSPEPTDEIPQEWLAKPEPGIRVVVAPHDAILLRWTTAYDAKLRKGQTYRSKGVVKDGDSYVIAIDGSQLGTLPVAHGASTRPYVVGITFGVGPIAYQFDKSSDRSLGAMQTTRLEIRNRNDAQVRTERFLTAGSEAVSALIGCSPPMFSGPQLPLFIAHNPLASVPIPIGMFGQSAEEWEAKMLFQDAEGQDWELTKSPSVTSASGA